MLDTSVPVLTPKKVKELITEELTEHWKEILDTMQHKFQSPSRYMIDFHKLLLMGDPAEEIVKTAEKEELDLIVVGQEKID